MILIIVFYVMHDLLYRLFYKKFVEVKARMGLPVCYILFLLVFDTNK